MVIVNADDLGMSSQHSDAAILCYEAGRITSASGMVFMKDSERAADMANGAGLDVGLHLNFTTSFTGVCRDALLLEYHGQIMRYLKQNKFATLLYNPALRQQFRYVYQAQVEEFTRLYGKSPSHVNGHHHRHLCANMLLDYVISDGQRVRRSLTFQSGEKNLLNRTYRSFVDHWLSRRYRLTDFFFDISAQRYPDFFKLADEATVEIMVHPIRVPDMELLMSDHYAEDLGKHVTGTYSSLLSSNPVYAISSE